MNAVTISIIDETATGKTLLKTELRLVSERITARELIKRRIQKEVDEFNNKESEIFQGLIQPTQTEIHLNGYRLKQQRRLDWEKQYNKAIEAFEHNDYILIAEEKQIETLDDKIVLTDHTSVTFLKLIPLVGG